MDTAYAALNNEAEICEKVGERMGIRFEQASMDDPDELIRLRIAYMKADFGDVREDDRGCIEKQLRDHFSRKPGSKLIAFAAKDEDRSVSVAYLPVIEMPANPTLLNGLYGVVLNVYGTPTTEEEGCVPGS